MGFNAMSLRRLVIAFMLSMALSAAVCLGLRAGGGAPKNGANLAQGVVDPSGPGQKVVDWSLYPTPPVAFGRGDPAAAALSVREIDRRQILEALKRTEHALDGPDTREMRRRLIAQFVALDPQMALSYVDTLAGDEYVRQKVNAMGAWAARDSAAAAAFFGENALLGGFTQAEDRQTAAAIVKEWVVQDPRAAFAWVSGLPEEARAEAVFAMVIRLAKHDPRIALQMVDSLEANYERAEAMRPLAEHWAQKAPVVAAAWVSALRNEPERNYAASGLLTGWMNADARAAIEWVSRLPMGSTRDAAVAAMVQTPAAQKNPETAVTWAASIQDAQLRGQVFPQVLQHWQALDAAAAERWLSSQR
jgi:hypothetical protein